MFKPLPDNGFAYSPRRLACRDERGWSVARKTHIKQVRKRKLTISNIGKLLYTKAAVIT